LHQDPQDAVMMLFVLQIIAVDATENITIQRPGKKFVTVTLMNFFPQFFDYGKQEKSLECSSNKKNYN
jgi:hypothetical protein